MTIVFCEEFDCLWMQKGICSKAEITIEENGFHLECHSQKTKPSCWLQLVTNEETNKFRFEISSSFQSHLSYMAPLNLEATRDIGMFKAIATRDIGMFKAIAIEDEDVHLFMIELLIQASLMNVLNGSETIKEIRNRVWTEEQMATSARRKKAIQNQQPPRRISK